MPPLPSLDRARLYTFVDTGYLAGRDPAEVARALCDGGSDLIQVRAKGMAPDGVRRIVKAVLPVTERAGIPLVLNDHWDLAVTLGCPWVHLGQEDFFDAGLHHVDQLSAGLAAAKRPAVGLSTHAPDQAIRAVAAGPGYIAIGPVFPTATKPGRPAATLDYVRWAAREVRIPWFAIGGINRRTLDQVLEAGARRICVVSDILTAADVAGVCREYRRRLDAAA
jgi:thiamine-phosphate pyrophosphorylase